MLLLLVWWAWNYTTWVTNFFDPVMIPVRLMLIVVMLLSLTMSVAIPDAFGDRAALFAWSYVALQVGRNVFAAAAVKAGTERRSSFVRILVWSLIAAPFWIWGAHAGADARTWIWIAALALEYAGPAFRYWLPTLGTTNTADWEIDGHHFAERFHLLIIIALGETIIVVGNGLSVAGLSGWTSSTSLLVGFLTTVWLWWLYFDVVADSGRYNLTQQDDPGLFARDVFTYLHLPIIAGIIAYAVALEIVVAHPSDELSGMPLAIALAGPLLYLIGHNAARRRMTGTWSHVRWWAAAAIAVLWPFGPGMSALALMTIMLCVLVATVVWESVSYRRWYPSIENPGLKEALRHLGR